MENKLRKDNSYDDDDNDANRLENDNNGNDNVNRGIVMLKIRITGIIIMSIMMIKIKTIK